MPGIDWTRRSCRGVLIRGPVSGQPVSGRPVRDQPAPRQGRRPRRGASWLLRLCPIAVAVLAVGLLPAPSTLEGAPFLYPRGVTIHNPLRAYQGLNLLVDASRDPALGQVVLLGMDGSDVQVWTSPFSGMDRAELAEALDNGNVLVHFKDPALGTEVLVELDWNGTIVWQYTPPVGTKLHHDFERLANGNTLLLASVTIDDPVIGPNPIRDDIVLEVNPSGQVVWEWSTAEHYDELPYSDVERNYMWLASKQQKANIFHTNSVSTLPPNPHEATDPRFAAGNLLLSQRDTNLVFIIERATGDMVWSYKQAVGQHMPYMLDASFPGAGNILMLDNGGQAGYPITSRLWSQALEIDPPSWATTWSYDATNSNLPRAEAFLTPFMGSAQRLPNGNTLITEATWGRVFEVTPTGAIVWEYILPADKSIYRCIRVDPTWPGGASGEDRGGPVRSRPGEESPGEVLERRHRDRSR